MLQMLYVLYGICKLVACDERSNPVAVTLWRWASGSEHLPGQGVITRVRASTAAPASWANLHPFLVTGDEHLEHSAQRAAAP